MRRLVQIAATTFLLIVVVSCWHVTGSFDLLRWKPHWTIEVNGAVVHGEVQAGRGAAVVTRRDAGKEHSYLLLYEGDVDQTGDVGQVFDCGEWLAPRLPILIQTSSLPQLQSTGWKRCESSAHSTHCEGHCRTICDRRPRRYIDHAMIVGETSP
jgi:hypothetical protein